ncbi:MAG: TolB family protein, partial [Bacteroidales bacterium]
MAATRKVAGAFLLLMACVAPPRDARAASRYDPALRFRTLTTPHFVIHFHQGEDAIARRFAPIAEQVHAELTRGLQRTPGGRTHVILVDQNDLANGWATPLPYDTVELTVAPPAQRESIGNVDDWLRVVFVHEYTHILHLDRSRGYASILRHVFGRSPIAFPNLFLPPWQTEGIATYEESAMTGRGRIHAGDFRLLVSTAARAGRAFPLDRASSDVEDWPSGNTPYAYGGFFHQSLAERYGAEKLGTLATRTAGRFYFLATPAFKDVYGKSLGELWKEFEQQQARRPKAAEDDPGRRLTSQGFVAAGPRFARDAHGRQLILYSSRTGHDFPALMSVDLEGRTGRVASRYLGEETSVADGAAVFDEQDLSRSVAFRSDLRLLDVASRRVDWLTRNGRFLDPAVCPTGRALAVVALRQGQRTLQVFDLPAGAWPRERTALRAALRATPRLELHEPGVDYSSPRWSPDGRWLAVARHERSGLSEIVVLDGATGRMFPLVSSATARTVTPAWLPDGRTLLFASDASGVPFNICAVDVRVDDAGALRPGARYQVTNFTTGATYPDVSPDASLLAYVGYTVAGYDVFVLPIERHNWTAISAEGGPTRRSAPTESVQDTVGADPRV